MNQYSIVTYPNQILRNKSEKVLDVFAPEIQELIPNLVRMMIEKDGLGLAAPQIGVNKQVIAINTESGPLVLINPEIISHSGQKKSGEEGCISIPDIFGLVKRFPEIRISGLSPDNKKMKFKATEMFARVLQHEIDHLNGVLFIDRLHKIIKGEKKLKELSVNDDLVTYFKK